MGQAPTVFNNSGLLTAAFSAIMDISLSENVSPSQEVEKVSLFDHHKTTYSYGSVGMASDTSAAKDQYKIFVQVLNGDKFEIKVPKNGTIEDIKEKINEQKSVKVEQQRLILAGRQLESGICLSNYDIKNEATIHLVARLSENKPVILDVKSLDPIHDYDFTDIRDENEKFKRGGEEYIRPCGFRRFALNISGRYQNLDWIDCNGGIGEWPVSYHATGDHSNKTFAEDGGSLTRDKQIAFNQGVFTTPDIRLAEKYAKKFHYDNEEYIIVFQNRVNPATLVKIQTPQEECARFWVSPTDKDVRPYGICIRKV